MTDELLFLYLNKEVTNDEQVQIKKWIEKHPKDFEKIKLIWEASKMEQKKDEPDLVRAWENVKQNITIPEKKKTSRTIRLSRRILQYAAVAILFISIGILGYYNLDNKNKDEWVAFTSSANTTKEVKLPDGSIVTLNNNSKIFYKNISNSDTREIKLLGEAFFNIKRNPNKPCYIYSANTVTQVLGTSFNVNANDSLNHIIVTVNSGKVAFYENKTSEEKKVYLTAGEVGLFTSKNKKLEKLNNEDSNYLAWKTNILIFRNASLPQLCKTLSKHFDTTISIIHPQLKEKRITARYQGKSLDQILNSLDATLDISHKFTDKGIELQQKE